MYVSWRWISEWVDTEGVDPVAFADRFTLAVAEIEAVVRFGHGLSDVLVGTVTEVAAHPNADKLRLATVDLGERTVQVVCGAPDLRVGLRAPFVPPGVTLPSGIEVRDGEVRGVRSPGMLASERDLGLSDEHAGLLSLDGVGAPDGTALPEAFALEDVLYEVDNKSVTHRPDLWGMYGVAREIAALLDRPLAALPTEVPLGEGQPVSLAVHAPERCSRYLCAGVEGVAVGPAPVALRMRLRSLGVRPISNIVDATNLVMLETGNPLHAFDAGFLRGGSIAVRRAAAGEEMKTLDGESRALTTEDLVIADGGGPVALAGVMGGLDSEIRDETRRLVLEAAHFEPVAIRKTSLRHGLRTESSARFEKSLDPALAEVAARRFLRLVLELCPGARVSSHLVQAGPFASDPPPVIEIETSAGYLRSRLGVDADALSDAWMDRRLGQLGFGVRRDGDALAVRVPSWRATRDVSIAEDLVEELGRHHGYDRIPSQTPLVRPRPPEMSPSRALERAIRQVAARQAGLHEVVLYSFDSESLLRRLGLTSDAPRVALRNTLNADATHLRRGLGAGLIAAVERNLRHGPGAEEPGKGTSVGLFELGRAFLPAPPGGGGGDDRDDSVLGLAPDTLPALARAGDAAGQRYASLLTPALTEGVEAAIGLGPLPLQPHRCALAIGERLGGGAEGERRAQPPQPLSVRLYRELVGVLELLAAELGLGPLHIARQAGPCTLPGGAVEDAPGWLHPARGAQVLAGGVRLGVVGLIHPDVRAGLEVAAEVAVAELDLEAIGQVRAEATAAGRSLKAGAPARFPAVAFDLTVRAQRTTAARALLDATRALLTERGAPVEDVALVGRYRDATDDDAVALTVRVRLREADRTLDEADVPDARALLAELCSPAVAAGRWALPEGAA